MVLAAVRRVLPVGARAVRLAQRPHGAQLAAILNRDGLAGLHAAAYDRGMIRKLLPLLAILLAPSAANADDASYCAQLSDLYRRYLLGSGDGNKFPDVTASVAMEDCAKGNYAAGIPPLEQKLRDARFTLPKRN